MRPGGPISAEEAARRRGVFLNALARTGNVGRACEESGAGKSMVYRRRGIDAGFAAAWEAALGAAREALEGFFEGEGDPSTRDLDKLGPCSGRTGVGEAGCTAGSRGGWVRRLREGQPQIARAPAKAWTEEKERTFLDTLAEQCHVGRAAAAVGMSAQAAYLRRRSRADFAAAWEAAIAAARAGLDAKLLRQAANGTRAEPGGRRLIAEPDEDAAIEDTGLALGLLKLAEARAAREGRDTRSGRWAGPPERPIQEVRARILARIEAIEAHEARGE